MFIQDQIHSAMHADFCHIVDDWQNPDSGERHVRQMAIYTRFTH